MPIELDKLSQARIEKKLDDFTKKISNKENIEVACQLVADNIKLRTRQGVDEDLQAFAPYNAKYAEDKGKTTVDLTDTGSMLKSISKRAISSNEGIIYFATERDQRIANKHQNIGVGKRQIKRKFFGISKIDTEMVKTKYLSMLKNAAREFNNG